MSKAQSLIFQFVIFFMAGFFIFITIGSFFSYQSDTFKNDVANYSRDLTSNYLLSAIVSQVETCKGCDYARYNLKLANSTAGFYMEISMDNSNGLSVRTVPGEEISVSDVYNLKDSMRISGSAASVEPINLTFSRTKNELKVE